MTTKKIVGTAVLSALTIVLTLVSNYITIGTISINLALLPIALAAIMYGPWCAMVVGFINGGFILFAPSTQGFMSMSPIGTILVCFLKTGLAGLISGFVFKLFKKHETAGMITSSLLIPFLNTGIFLIGSLIFFNGTFGDIINVLVSVNFAIEFTVTAILSPTTVRVINIYKIRNH